jgi:hypothetical protein
MPIAGNVVAQTSPPPQRPAQTTSQPDKGEAVTVVGCLEQGNTTGAGSERRSETGAANANDYFLRASGPATPAGGTASAGSPSPTTTSTTPSGTAASGGTASGTTMYRVTGLDREQLRPHVGHRVELQGHLTSNMTDRSGSGMTSGTPGTSGTTAGTTAGTAGTASSSTSPAGSGTGTGQRRDQRGGQGNEGRDVAGVLHATAIKMVSATCP